jgi:hypothetical protein
VTVLKQEAQKALNTLTPTLEQTAKDAIAAELKRLQTNTRMQDVALIAGMVVVAIIAVLIFGSALLGNVFAQGLVTKTAVGLGGMILLLARGFSGTTIH